MQQFGDFPTGSTRRQEWVRLTAEVDVFRGRCKVDPSQTEAIPPMCRGRPVGAELAARVTALEKAKIRSTPSNPPDEGRRVEQKATARIA